jgi:hypothetical protein
MNRTMLGAILVSAATLFVAGCPHQAVVHNVENASFVVGTPSYSEDDVKKAIVRAGAALGWSMQETEPGQIVGTLYLRSHMAQVDIPYSKSSYSILYKDSSNLNYDGTKIHSNYNGWIQNLDRGIKNQLNLL